MNCEICNKGMAEGATLYRVNEKGVKGIWRCPEHLTEAQRKAIDPEIAEIVGIIEIGNCTVSLKKAMGYADEIGKVIERKEGA